MSNDLVITLFHWAVLLSHYPSTSIPEVSVVPHSILVHLACNDSPCRVVGWTRESSRVYIDESLDLDATFDSSILVHEFVHALQYANKRAGDVATCERFIQWEREAYNVQQQYLIQYGDYRPLSFNLMDVAC